MERGASDELVGGRTSSPDTKSGGSLAKRSRALRAGGSQVRGDTRP
jgi:hypothetical protein